jgi:carboxylate-amine ligase
MKSDVGIVGRNQLTFATHVHVGVPSGNMAMFIMRHLIPCLPVLLAVAANSPFWRGHETGYASYRHCILAASMNYGLPPYFEDWDDFVRFFHMAQRAEVFSSFKDIHWDIRPHPDLGTVELRIMDAASTVQTAVALAAFARSLAVYLMDHVSTDLADWPVRRLPRWIEQINRYQASHRGLDASYIADAQGDLRPLRDLATELMTLIKPIAQRIGEAQGIAHLEAFLEQGPGHERQEKLFQEVED